MRIKISWGDISRKCTVFAPNSILKKNCNLNILQHKHGIIKKNDANWYWKAIALFSFSKTKPMGIMKKERKKSGEQRIFI